MGASHCLFIDLSLPFMYRALPFRDLALPFLDLSLPFLDLALPFRDLSLSFIDHSLPFVYRALPFLDLALPFLDLALPFLDLALPFIYRALPFLELFVPFTVEQPMNAHTRAMSHKHTAPHTNTMAHDRISSVLRSNTSMVLKDRKARQPATSLLALKQCLLLDVRRRCDDLYRSFEAFEIILAAVMRCPLLLSILPPRGDSTLIRPDGFPFCCCWCCCWWW